MRGEGHGKVNDCAAGSDTLCMNEPSMVYYVNEVKYPFNTPYYSVRVESQNQQKQEK